MELKQLLAVTEKRGATQAVISTNAPPRFLCNDQWSEGGTAPSDYALRQIVESGAPPHLVAQIASNRVEFDAQLSDRHYRVVVRQTGAGRVLVLTLLDKNGEPTRPLPPLDDAPARSQSSFSPTSAPFSASSNPTIQASASSRETHGFAPSALSQTSSLPRANLAPSDFSSSAPRRDVQSVAPDTTSPAQSAAPAFHPVSVPPSTTATEQWYYALNGRQIGPVDRPNIECLARDGVVSRETMVWREGMPDWTMAKLSELSPILESFPPGPPRSSFVENGYSSTPSNDSGLGENSVLPAELNGFNWGAFWLAPVWLCNHGLVAWGIGLFFFNLLLSSSTPLIALTTGIVAGVMGNNLAWKNRIWRDVSEFRETQRTWGRAGLAVFALFLILGAFSASQKSPEVEREYSRALPQ